MMEPKKDGSVRVDEHSKDRQMEAFREVPEGQYLTTDQGVRISDTDNSLKAGARGPTLMEDFHFREKVTHFDHESMPERIVHARGAGAHGYFQVYESMAKYTRAGFLQDPSRRTPVFARFSTVAGSRGSADTVRDVRGFATKFYTDEGVFDLVGNNIPVFFIQDANKFPDFVHAVKPEPHNEIPQASTAHDTFWDFTSLVPELAHMIMWVLSDRAIPRSFRMMEGFGVNTFRWVNAAGEAHFVKWHWMPALGTASLVWDEAHKLAGKDPDWLRRDLWEAIEMGDYPEFELAVQMIEEKDEFKFDFDVLDATKIWPEDDVPLMKVGKMVLDRNPDNFFAETEQVAFHPGNVVPGIDFTNDPLLQGRLFSYLDTQLNRFNSANFHEIPINRTLAPVHSNQRAGFMRMTINKGRTSYYPNSLGSGCPMLAPESMGGYVHYMEKVDGRKIRERSESFKDHFSQAALFWHSLTGPEQERLVQAAHFELGNVETREVRSRVVHEIFNKIDHDLAVRVAKGVGIAPPAKNEAVKVKKRAPEVSILHRARTDTVKSRRIAILAADGFNYDELTEVQSALKKAGAHPAVVSLFLGTITGDNGKEVEVDKSLITTASIMYDAVYVPGGKESIEAMKMQGDALHFVNEAFKHGKAVGATSEGVDLLRTSSIASVNGLGNGVDGQPVSEKGVITLESPRESGLKARIKSAVGSGDGIDVSSFTSLFIQAIAQHRFPDRTAKAQVPA